MMRSWIHFTRGRFVRQARVGLGDLREEHLSRQGFAGPVAMLYRTAGPNEVVRVEGDYRSRAVDCADVVSTDAGGYWQPMTTSRRWISPSGLSRGAGSTSRHPYCSAGSTCSLSCEVFSTIIRRSMFGCCCLTGYCSAAHKPLISQRRLVTIRVSNWIVF